MRSALVLALLVAATQVSFLRSKAPLLIHRWPLQFSEGSAAPALDKADLVRQHVQVADCFISLDAKAKKALLQFSVNCISKYTALLHVKHDADGKRISGYYGAGIYGYDSEVLEKMCPGLGEFAETIYSGFGAMFIKFMVYTANEAVFPLHRDGLLHQNLFRVSISLSKCMPDFAMCYENTKNVFGIARGFLHVVIMDMDMHAAGRMALHRGRGVIKHGTLRTATDGAVFFVFDVLASDWAAMPAKLSKWLGLIGWRFGQAAYTTAKWASALPLTKLEELRQFSGMKTGQTIVDTLDFAHRPSSSNSQSSSSDGSASKRHKTTGTYPLNTTDHRLHPEHQSRRGLGPACWRRWRARR
jgi:hypothetical protein